MVMYVMSASQTVFCRCRERLLQQVRRDRKVVAAVRCARLEPTSCQAANAVVAHQTGDASLR